MSHYKGKRISKKTRRRTSIRTFLLVIFLLGLIIGAYKSFRIIYANAAARKAYSELRLSTAAPPAPLIKIEDENRTDNNADADIDGTDIVEAENQAPRSALDFSALKETNPEIAGWLKAEGIGIDYPVMHTDNNEYYLTHLYDGTPNANGALFIDFSNTEGFKDDNTVIYGHNMRSGAMFNVLNEYKSQDFYDAWPTMTLYTPEGDYLIELICGTIEDGDYAFVEFNFDDEDDFCSYIESRRSRSTFQSNVEIGPEDRIISLCTCSYEWNNARYMIMGKLTPIMEDPTR